MIERSQGELRPRNYGADRLPKMPTAGLTAAERDPTTGQFRPGNTVSRRRKIRRIAKSLPWLDPNEAEPWLAPFLRAAKEHAVDLLAEVSDLGPIVAGVAEELALARVMARALVQLGAKGDRKALEEARGWLREARQAALALEGLARDRAALQSNAAEQADIAKLLQVAAQPRGDSQ